MGDFEFEGPTPEEIWKKIGSSSWVERFEGLMEAASQKFQVDNDAAGAIPYLEEARDGAAKNDDYSSLAHVYMLLGMCYWNIRDYKSCAEMHEAGADAAKQGMEDELEIDHLAHAARSYRKIRDYGSMRRNFELALKLGEERSHSYLASMRAEYGRILRKLGDVDAALPYLELAYSDTVPGPSARAAGELVSLKLDSGDVAGALECAQEAYAASNYMNDQRGLNASQFNLAKAQLAAGDFGSAKKSLDEIRERQKWGKVKHKVRVDVLEAEVLMRMGDWDAALPMLELGIPMLRKEKLWNDLGAALILRAECLGVMGNVDGYSNSMLEAALAFDSASNVAAMSKVYVQLAFEALIDDSELAEVYALRVVEQVLLFFSSVHNEALGIYCLALIGSGKREVAAAELERLGAVSDLSGVALAYYYEASCRLATGVRSKNLAAKAVREYLLAGGRLGRVEGLATFM